jgi:hypothetical protein
MVDFRRAAALVLTALALGVARAHAQRSAHAVGFQAGYANSSLQSQSLEALESRQGAFVGVYYRARVLSWLTLQPEMDFTLKGGEVPLGEAIPSLQSLSLDLGVLEVPLLIKVAPPYRRESLRPFLFGGASIGLEVGCTRTLVAANDQVRSIDCSAAETLVLGGETLDVAPLKIPSPDVSWIVGAGIQWERKDIGIGIEARFQRGLREVLPADPTIRNQLWAIVLALTI